MRVVLAGNPNAGKTTLFNALTRSRLRTGNFHGVTTQSVTKRVGDVYITDSPGLYSFEAYTMEESEAAESIRSADVIINVVDSLNLPNSLRLTRLLARLNGNVAVYLTKTRALAARGGRADIAGLEAHLGLPVYDCPPKELKKLILSRSVVRPVRRRDIALDEVYDAGNYRIRPFERPFYSKVFAPLIFVAVMLAAFFFTFHPAMPGAMMKEALEELLCVRLAGFLASGMRSPVFASFFCGGVLGGAGGVLSFIPQLAMLWLALALLDESGAMSALCFVTDGIFSKVNLSGRSAFCLISGLGCTAAAISSARGFSARSSRARTVAMLPFVPCGAKLPVFLTFLSPVFENPFPAVCALYFAGLALSVGLAAVIRGEPEGLVCEITPISLPQFSALKNKLCFQLASFIIKVSTAVAAFCAVGWLLSHFSPSLTLCAEEQSLLARVCRALLPLFRPMGADDWRLVYALISGFAARENVAAVISMMMGDLVLPLPSAVGCCVFVLAGPACISAFAAACREVGFRTALFYNCAQLAFAFLLSYAARFLFSLP